MRDSLKLIGENVSCHMNGNQATVDGFLGLISFRLVDGLKATTRFSDSRTAHRYMTKVPYLNRDVFVCDIPYRECRQRKTNLLPLTVDAVLLKASEVSIGFQGLFDLLQQVNQSIAYGYRRSQLRRALATLCKQAMHKRDKGRSRHSKHAPDCLPESQPISPMERRHA